MDDMEACNNNNNNIIIDELSPLQNQKIIWLKEQLAVAAKVKVLPDDDDSSSEQISILHEKNQEGFALLSTSSIIQQQPNNEPCCDGKNDDKKQSNPSSDDNNYYYYGGVDVSFPKSSNSNPSAAAAADHNEQEKESAAVAVYVIIDARTMTIIYQDYEFFYISHIPYISSFLAFREINALERLIHKQLTIQPKYTPRAILVDGNGILHSRQAGLACFVGVRTGIPTIGVAKTLYCHGGLTEHIVKNGIDLSLQRVMMLIQHHNSLSWQRTRDESAPTTAARTTTTIETGMVIWDRKSIRAPEENENVASSSKTISFSDSQSTPSRADDEGKESSSCWLSSLPSSCLGLAIPLECRQCIKDCNVSDEGNVVEESIKNNDRNSSFEVLASALVGHGGRKQGDGQAKKKKSTAVGSCCGSTSTRTKSPIFISVGHDISLQNAVQICALLSLFRIPEPIRQADLIGRDLLRNKGNIINK